MGKSTWVRAAFPDAVYVDLLDERLYQDLLGDPSLFAQSIGDLAPDGWVVVDEVQRLPSLLNEVHRLIEARRLRFALLGSSARKLRAAGVNLLAGRALRKSMFPLTASELGPAFDLDRVLRHGSIPSGDDGHEGCAAAARSRIRVAQGAPQRVRQCRIWRKQDREALALPSSMQLAR